ncbi:nuclease-related domain-containing protein [Streptomyces cylindrosporus]|uniref:NERD domain-containing protein n=1 Tax=Streptomyces cylindrosporus TaxID=2927583 RepID=A0ABS9YPK7_9ACTN|nr:nuclease-related domain-containing protein [Streptomyces cylindrosporus]MCI3279152.1 NERD domain-containing protein [Streptomyces cylindrosporus]
MTSYENSAMRWAEETRKAARRGLWRRLTAALGVSAQARRADALAARREHGGRGEAVTAALLAQLQGQGWAVRHDRRIPYGAQLDHVLVPPTGTAVVVLDTKTWHRGWPTVVRNGRVCCGTEDRHDQVVKVAGYAARVQQALGLPGVVVWPLLVVHNSPVAGGELAVRVPGWDDFVYVLETSRLIPRLAGALYGPADPVGAAAIVERVDRVLRPYGEGG